MVFLTAPILVGSIARETERSAIFRARWQFFSGCAS
jgi:hypothetical protein